MQSIDFYIQKACSVVAADDFAKQVIQWQQVHGRNNLPWQTENNPYHVLVSELMLQQTQVQTVIPYFNRWLERFPDVQSLADAPEDDVMQLWQGLGYYRRARNLHAAAMTVVEHYQGKIPENADQLREIPGVGPYTVGAIRAFAFDASAAIVDGNVKRLFARLFSLPFLVNKSSFDRYFWALAEHYTPQSNGRRFAQGLLDLGATICKPTQPQCGDCPFRLTCRSYQDNTVTDFPKRAEKKATPTRSGYFALDINDAGILLLKRGSDSVWPNLWCLPELEAAAQGTPDGHFKHTFSHYKLHATVWRQTLAPSQHYRRVALTDLDSVGLPAPIRTYLQQINT
ncbi:Adenine DNA glycosylase [Pseudidiomarina piscicola]|uniref:Adenine DNA glycosylase n=1 Tax=Pseudidiomarina piscicola TaxID=2614830 RepID=A0A6S6WP57_9GAMM|nr:A/G-specific adenine glycosylase [Pseudidiomarina piscicola]CAB0151923.1 Adenine DNA glycosylase [Pseudidiomarina piscicola]VZT41364.1 Adenine DNA glycosylase [Pseudomonas aeruginosa]